MWGVIFYYEENGLHEPFISPLRDVGSHTALRYLALCGATTPITATAAQLPQALPRIAIPHSLNPNVGCHFLLRREWSARTIHLAFARCGFAYRFAVSGVMRSNYFHYRYSGTIATNSSPHSHTPFS